MQFDAIIIGGGLAGLSCALALADGGLRVAVLERDSMLGGRARSWVDSRTGDTIDIGPHVVHTEYRNFLGLLDRLGTRELIAWEKQKLLTIATSPPTVLRHAPLPPPLHLVPSLASAPEISLRDLLSMARVGWQGMSFGEEDVPALDRLSAREFLRSQGVSERMIEFFWAFAAMLVMAVPLERCSAAALLRVHAGLSSRRGLHFGFASVGLAQLYAQAATRVIEESGGRVLLGAQVRSIVGAGKAEGVVLADGTMLKARHCVSAVPPPDLEALLPDEWQGRVATEAIEAFEPSPYISCYLWFDRKITRESFWAGPWSPSRFNYDFYDLSNVSSGWGERGSVIASNIIYSHRAKDLSDAEIVDITRREIAEFAPEAGHARIEHAVVNRIPMAIPCPTPGSELRRPLPRTDVPGLVLAGDWIRTHLPATMESAVCSGRMAAECVLADTGRPRKLALPQRPRDGFAFLARGLRLARYAFS